MHMHCLYIRASDYLLIAPLARLAELSHSHARPKHDGSAALDEMARFRGEHSVGNTELTGRHYRDDGYHIL